MALVLAVAAVCGLLVIAAADAKPLRAAGQGLWGHDFVGVSVEDKRGKQPPFADVGDVQVSFSRLRTRRGAQQWIGFKATCNSMGAQIHLTRSRIKVGAVISTSIACEPASRGREDSWLRAFSDGNPHWRVHGKRLTLSSGPKTLRLWRK